MTSELRDLLEPATRRAARHRPGMVMGVLSCGERSRHAAGDLAVDSIVEIGSVTKVFTATLLAEAVVRGEVRLDTPVASLLPPGARLPTRDGVAITLEHLATHTSGLPRSPVGVPVVAGSLTMLRGRNPYAGFEPDDLLTGLARTRLRRTPGSGRPAYSNTGFALLGLALAAVAGTTYDDLVTQRICDPLGLTDTVTALTATSAHRERWAAGHRGRGRAAEDWALTGIAGAGALRSTVDDLLTFLAHQLDPSGSPLETAIRLTQEQRAGRGRWGVGLGWQRNDAGPVLWHNGGTGGFRSLVAFRPGRGRAVVALTDCTRGVDLAGLRLLEQLGAVAPAGG